MNIKPTWKLHKTNGTTLAESFDIPNQTNEEKTWDIPIAGTLWIRSLLAIVIYLLIAWAVTHRGICDHKFAATQGVLYSNIPFGNISK